jgi:hypothetical protein
MCLHRFRVTASNTLDSSAPMFIDICPRWLAAVSPLQGLFPTPLLAVELHSLTAVSGLLLWIWLSGQGPGPPQIGTASYCLPPSSTSTLLMKTRIRSCYTASGRSPQKYLLAVPLLRCDVATATDSIENTTSRSCFIIAWIHCCRGDAFIAPLPSNMPRRYLAIWISVSYRIKISVTKGAILSCSACTPLYYHFTIAKSSVFTVLRYGVA